MPTKLQYIEKSVSKRDLSTQIFWTFELGTQEGINIPIGITVGFQQRDTENSQSLNNDTFYRPQVTSAECIIGTGKYYDSAILLKL